MKNHKGKVHFVGIGGSGMSAAAMIAKSQGYEVTGCDLQEKTAYSEEFKDSGIQVLTGHDKEHIKDADLVAVTPAVFFQNQNHPEISEAKKEGKLLTWEKFLGGQLQFGKKVVCIAGTHGKSTMSALAGLIFEKAKLDPSVMVGGTLKEWKANFRSGSGKYFITEADEFFDSFLNYSPEIIVLNNIEFDHPDYFKDESEVTKSFEKFIERLKGEKTLIFNQDSEGIKKLFSSIGEDKLSKIKLVGYSAFDPVVSVKNSFRAKDVVFGKKSTDFLAVNNQSGYKENFSTLLPGKFSVSNVLGIIALSQVAGIESKHIKEVLTSFNGIGRRMELITEKKGIAVYDDYAHHPTAIKETLHGLRQKYPKNKIWVIVEPHTFSRTKALLSLYKDSFTDADEVIIAPIFKSRDKEDFGVNGEDIVSVSGAKSVRYLDTFDKIAEEIGRNVVKGDVVIVMGAGLSYKLARLVADKI